MTENHKFYIDQTLHGYSNGHRLLEKSCQFSDRDNKMMVVLSDLSGNEMVKGFEQYFTGYRLPDSQKIVLACTWYAKNMIRPGCVWTQSLIFDENDLYMAGQMIEEILLLFIEPDGVHDYKKTITLVNKRKKQEQVPKEKLKYLCWCIWGSQSPVIINADNSLTYLKELIYLYFYQNINLKDSFMFSTGSLAIRRYESKVFDLQIMPRKYSIDKNNVQVNKVPNQSEIRTYPVWVEKTIENIERDNLRSFVKFKSLFPSNYMETYYFSAFMKIYVGSLAMNSTFSISKFMDLVDALFEEEKQELGSVIIEKLLSGELLYFSTSYDYSSILISILKYNWLQLEQYEIYFLVTSSIGQSIEKAKECFVLYVKSEQTTKTHYVINTFIENIYLDQFETFTDLKYEYCSLFITMNQEFALCEKLWRQTQEYQKAIIKCLKINNCSENLIKKITRLVLNISQFDLVTDLYMMFGVMCVRTMVAYYLENSISPKLLSIEKIALKNKNICLSVFKEKIWKNKIDEILKLIKLINSYTIEDGEIGNKEILKLYEVFLSGKQNEKQGELLARFILPLIFLKSLNLSEEVVNFVFQIVNTKLADQTFPEEEWVQLERKLVEVNSYNKWDRCRRLKKSIKKAGYKLKSFGFFDELDTHLL